MATFADDQAYISKIRKMASDNPIRLLSELHEAHYLLEENVISETAYETVKEICMKYAPVNGEKSS